MHNYDKPHIMWINCEYHFPSHVVCRSAVHYVYVGGATASGNHAELNVTENVIKSEGAAVDSTGPLNLHNCVRFPVTLHFSTFASFLCPLKVYSSLGNNESESVAPPRSEALSYI